MDDEIIAKTPAAVYIRKSQERQDRQVLSVEGQLKKTKMLVAEYGLKPVFMPAEERTASKRGRPIFRQMMEKIEAGEARYIVCWKANRLARNPTDAGQIIQAMDDGKLLAVITDRGTYHNSPRDKHNLWEELGDSKKFSDDLSKDVLDGYERKYERGEYPSEAFTGYVNVKYDKYNRNIAPCSVNAPKVREIFEMAMTGRYKLDDLYRHAVETELRTPRGNIISKTGLQDLLQRKAYTGTYWHGGAWRVGSYKTYLTMDEHDLIQLQMGWVTKRRSNYAHKDNYSYKVMNCGNCQHTITAYTKTKTLKNGTIASYIFYVCTRKSKVVKCQEPQVGEAEIEKQMFSHLGKIKLTAEEAGMCRKLVKHFEGEDYEKAESRVRYWVERKKTADRAIDELSVLLSEGVLDRERYDRLTNEHFKVLEAAKSKTSAYATNTERRLELTDRFFSRAVDVLDTFKKANESERRELLVEVGLNWTLEAKTVQFTPREPYDILVNRTENPDWRALVDAVWNYYMVQPQPL